MRKYLLVFLAFLLITILSCDSRSWQQFVRVRGTVDGLETNFDLYYQPGGSEDILFLSNISGTYEMEVFDEGFIHLRASKLGYIVYPPETLLQIDRTKEFYDVNFNFIDSDYGYVRISGTVDANPTGFDCLVEHPTGTDTVTITSGFSDYTLPEIGLFRFIPIKPGYEATPQIAELSITSITDVRTVAFAFEDTNSTSLDYFIYAQGSTDAANVSFSLIYTGPESDSVFIPNTGQRIDLSTAGEYIVRAKKPSFITSPAEINIVLSPDNLGDTVDFHFAIEDTTPEIEIFIKSNYDDDDYSFTCQIQRDDPPFNEYLEIPSSGYLFTSSEYGNYTLTPIVLDILWTPSDITLNMSETNTTDTAIFEFYHDIPSQLIVTASEELFTLYFSQDTLAGWTSLDVTDGHHILYPATDTPYYLKASKDLFYPDPSLHIVTLTASSPEDSIHFDFIEIPDYESEIYFADFSGGRAIFTEDMFGAGYTSFDGEGFFPTTQISDIHITEDHIYLLDYSNGRIIRMDDMSGSGFITFEGEDYMSLYQPTRIITDSYDRIYITDTGNHRIVRFDNMTGGGFISLEAEEGEPRLFSFPSSIAIDGYGRIYIADSGNSRIVRVEDMLGYNWREYSDGLVYPVDIALDDSERLYIADRSQHTIIRISDIFGSDYSTTPHLGDDAPLSLDVIGSNIIYWGSSTGIYRTIFNPPTTPLVYWEPSIPCSDVVGIHVIE